jgi:hypothetical protein
MRTFLKNIARKLPVLNALVSERAKLQSEVNALKSSFGFVPPGHFYSPLPSLDEIKKDESKIFGSVPRDICSLDLHEAEQLNLLEKFIPYYKEMPHRPSKREGLRYYFENPHYSYSDAILLHCMIRFLRPNSIIEVGSGFSSCMMLDTNDLFFGGSIEVSCIEPYPEMLFSLIKDTDNGKMKKMQVIPSRLQDVDLAKFEILQANDILFIDSTHVSKINSDVNRILFEILPRLSSGVYVHFHDIFFPFEYPKEWVYEGRTWNEAYLLKAFLQYNSGFRIVLMNTFMEHFHEGFFREKMPLCLKNTGASIWIVKE